MPSSPFFELVCKCLPKEIQPDELTRFGKPEWWEKNPRLAVAYALRKCPHLNWLAYLENYPDVKEAGINPVLHFLKYGVYEKRNLYSSTLYNSIASHTPKISVVVVNFNNGIFLNNCLGSVVNQTLKNIEIIVVDDASTDNSMKIIRKFASIDERIKVISFEQNQSTHMARKAGVARATGEYVMFLDSDDFYDFKACEKAYASISLGYDIVAFNMNIVNLGHLSQTEVHAQTVGFNGLPSGRYENRQIAKLAFSEACFSWIMINKIFKRSLVQDSYASLENFNCIMAEDLYAYLVISFKSHTLLKINDKLYFYTRGAGITSKSPEENKAMDLKVRNKVLPFVQAFCIANNLHEEYKFIRRFLLEYSLSIISLISSTNITSFFLELISQFGALYTSIIIMKYYFFRIDEISNKFFLFSPLTRNIKKNKKIGILCRDSPEEDFQLFICNIRTAFEARGYKIVLFVEKSASFCQEDEDDYAIYIYSHGSSIDDTARRLRVLYQRVQLEKIDCMLFIDTHEPLLLWDIILLRLLGIGAIGYYHLNFNYELLLRGQRYHHSSHLNTLRCLDKLICMDSASEMYFRSQNIDAIYPSAYINERITSACFNTRPNTILVVSSGRDSLEKMEDYLLILDETLQSCPDAGMIFIKDFADDQKRDEFIQQVESKKLLDKVQVFSPDNNLVSYFDQVKVFLSTAILSTYSIATAREYGLPVVIFNQDIQTSPDSLLQPGIFGSMGIKSAAMKIIELFTNVRKWEQCFAIARKKSANYAKEQLERNLVDLIENYDTYSSISKYTSYDYQLAIRSMAIYAGKSFP